MRNRVPLILACMAGAPGIAQAQLIVTEDMIGGQLDSETWATIHRERRSETKDQIAAALRQRGLSYQAKAIVFRSKDVTDPDIERISHDRAVTWRTSDKRFSGTARSETSVVAGQPHMTFLDKIRVRRGLPSQRATVQRPAARNTPRVRR